MRLYLPLRLQTYTKSTRLKCWRQVNGPYHVSETHYLLLILDVDGEFRPWLNEQAHLMTTTAEHAHASDIGAIRYRCFYWLRNSLFSRRENQHVVDSSDTVYGVLDGCQSMINVANPHFI